MRLLTRDKALYRQLLMIAVPVALQNLINFSISMADNVMVGRLGDLELSAVSLANQVWYVYNLFTFGVASGANVLLAQFWGKKDTDSMHKVLSLMYRILLGGGVVFSVIALCFPNQAMRVFTPDPEVIGVGASYLRIIGYSYILMGFSNATVIMLRSVGSVRISLVVYLSSLVTNVFLNWVLIFGNLGAPAMGVRGAAIATCCARVVEIVIVVYFMVAKEDKIRYNPRSFFDRRLGIMRRFVDGSLPVLINELMWGTGTALIAVIIGHMGREFTVANSICSILSQLVTITIFGVGNAAAVITGNTVGAGRYKEAKEYANTFVSLSVLLGLFACAMVLLLKNPIISLYNTSAETRMYASQIISVYSVVVIFQAFAAISLIGVLRGGGDTRFVLVMDLLFMWCISIPLGFLTGLGLGWPVVAVYAVIKVDEVFKTVFSFARVRRGNWINDITQS